MNARSWLFVPGDSERKIDRAERTAADALVLDLEDSVVPAAKEAARGRVAGFIAARPKMARTAQLWVRIDAIDAAALDDLVAVVPALPDGIMLPKASGPQDVARLSHYLDALEAQSHHLIGSIAVVPVTTETAQAPFALGDYAKSALPRLAGLTWGAEDLAACLGATTNREPSGAFALTYRIVRSATLLAAAAAGVPAIETLHADLGDQQGLERSSREAAQEGFAGRIAIHPDQVDAINAAFSPSADDIAVAKQVIEAFAASSGQGAIRLHGRILDLPHLKQAQRTLLASQSTRQSRYARS